MSFILDCSSGEKACSSISYGFSCSSSELRSVLKKNDLCQIYEKNWENIDIPFDQYVYDYVVRELGPHREIESVNWFHTTRTLPDNYYSEGIKPLGNALKYIWDTLINYAPSEEVKENLARMRSEGVPDFHYETKSDDPFHWGPYGILVREVAFHVRKLCQHDYLEMPEIVEDICNGYATRYKKNIYEHYRSLLVPKIVKFNSNKFIDVGCVEAALCYLYEYVRGNPPGGACVACFDGEGEHIQPEYILNIETISP